MTQLVFTLLCDATKWFYFHKTFLKQQKSVKKLYLIPHLFGVRMAISISLAIEIHKNMYLFQKTFK